MGCKCGSDRIFRHKDIDICADCGREQTRFSNSLKKVFPKNIVCKNYDCTKPEFKKLV